MQIYSCSYKDNNRSLWYEIHIGSKNQIAVSCDRQGRWEFREVKSPEDANRKLLYDTDLQHKFEELWLNLQMLFDTATNKTDISEGRILPLLISTFETMITMKWIQIQCPELLTRDFSTYTKDCLALLTKEIERQIQSLKEQFIGRDDDFWGVKFDDERSWFEGIEFSGVQCTGFACRIRQMLGSDRVKIFGFLEENNPESAIAQMSGGHDFAIVDDRFIVDPWIVEIWNHNITPRNKAPESLDGRGVFNIEDNNDKNTVTFLYGYSNRWKRNTIAERIADGEKL